MHEVFGKNECSRRPDHAGRCFTCRAAHRNSDKRCSLQWCQHRWVCAVPLLMWDELSGPVLPRWCCCLVLYTAQINTGIWWVLHPVPYPGEIRKFHLQWYKGNRSRTTSTSTLFALKENIPLVPPSTCCSCAMALSFRDVLIKGRVQHRGRSRGTRETGWKDTTKHLIPIITHSILLWRSLIFESSCQTFWTNNF